MGRLNQLRLTDDTRIGFALILAFLLLDTHFNPGFGGWRLLYLVQENPAPHHVGWLQNAMLVGVAAALGIARVRRHRAMRVVPVENIDPVLAALAARTAGRVAGRRVKFYVTPNILDKNAFSMFSARAPYIILGGGLRREARRNPERAAAVIAHECAHVAAHDTVFLLLTWYAFLAYVALAFLELVLGQAYFWSHEKLSSADPSVEFNFVHFLIVRRHLIFNAGCANLISIAGVAVALIHFIKQREYRADETASHFGCRETLISVLSDATYGAKPGFLSRILARFHPSATERLQRLADEQWWAHFDWLFVASMAFIISRVRDRVPSIATTISPPVVDGTDVGETLSAVLETVIWTPGLWKLLFELVLFLALAFIFSLHTYHATATQYKLGFSFSRRMIIGIDVISALFFGTFTAMLTQSLTVRRLTDPYLPVDLQMTWSEAVDAALHAAFIFVPGLVFTIALVLLTPLVMRLPPAHRLVQAPLLFMATLLVSELIHALGNTLLLGSMANFNAQFGKLTVNALPILSEMSLPRFPNSLELAIFSVWAYALFLLTADIVDRRGKTRPPIVHASRLVQDHEPGELSATRPRQTA